MYITKATLNPRRRGAKHLLASPQRMHAAVLSGFAPDQVARQGSGRVLWRLDPAEHHTDLLVVSPGLPDLVGLVEDAGWPATTPAQTKDYTPFLERVVRGSRWHFRLRANPVHAVRKPGWERSRRLGHVTAEHQAQWWLEHAERVGLAIVDPVALPVDPVRAADRVQVLERQTLSFGRAHSSGTHARVTLTTAAFEGHAEVAEADQVRAALVEGVGRARAYGCGLLTLVAGPS